MVQDAPGAAGVFDEVLMECSMLAELDSDSGIRIIGIIYVEMFWVSYRNGKVDWSLSCQWCIPTHALRTVRL